MGGRGVLLIQELGYYLVLEYSRRFHIFNTTTTQYVWTRRVMYWKGLQDMVIEEMDVLWEG